MVPGPDLLDFRGSQIHGGTAYATLALRRLAQSDPDVRFHVYLGAFEEPSQVAIENLPSNMTVRKVTVPLEAFDGIDLSISSNQHGAILSYLYATFASQRGLALILDPDCFVLTDGLVSSLIATMESMDLTMVGTPYPYFYPLDYPTDFPTLYFLLIRTSDLWVNSSFSFIPDQTQSAFGGRSDRGMSRTLSRLFSRAERLLFPSGPLACADGSTGTLRILIASALTRLRKPSILAGDTGHQLRRVSTENPVRLLPSIAADDFAYGERNRRPTRLPAGRVRDRWTLHRRALTWRPTSIPGRKIWKVTRAERLAPPLDWRHRPAESVTWGVDFPELAVVHKNLEESNLPQLSSCMLYAWESHPALLHLGHLGKTDVGTDERRVLVAIEAMRNRYLH